MVVELWITFPDFEFTSVAPVKLIPDMSTPLKSLFDKLTDGPTMYPFESWYFIFVGRVVVVKNVSLDPETFPDDVFVKMALVKLLPVISDDVSSGYLVPGSYVAGGTVHVS